MKYLYQPILKTVSIIIIKMNGTKKVEINPKTTYMEWITAFIHISICSTVVFCSGHLRILWILNSWERKKKKTVETQSLISSAKCYSKGKYNPINVNRVFNP